MTHVTIESLLPWICLAAGCAAEAPTPHRAQRTAAVTAGQSCSSDCECDRGLRCTNGTCQGFVEFGPIPAPPLSPACVCDSQCPSGTLCSNPQNTPTSYGYCHAYQCSLTFAPYYVGPGDSTALSLTSDPPPPPGSYTLLYGTRDGVTDVAGARFDLTAGTFAIANTPGLAGAYVRYATIHRPNGELLCSTASTASCFGETPTCSP